MGLKVTLLSFIFVILVRFLTCSDLFSPLPKSGANNSLPSSSMVKNPPASARDAGSIPESGRLPEKGNENPLQYSCLGNPIGRGAWQATVHGVAKELDTTEHACTQGTNYAPHGITGGFKSLNYLVVCLMKQVLDR